MSGKLQKRGEFSKRETGNHVAKNPKERRILKNRDREPCRGSYKREENSPKERLGIMSGQLQKREFSKRETGDHVREAPKDRILQKRHWEPCRGISKREENSPKEGLGTMLGKLQDRGEFSKRETRNHVREAPKEGRILQM